MWSIHYDETYDLIFIFIGKIQLLEGRAIGLPINVTLTPEEKKNTELMKCISIYTTCTVKLDLVLQVWNVEDRILMDVDHRKRAIIEVNTLHTIEKFDEPMSYFKIMKSMKNKYGDYSDILNVDSQVYFFKDLYNLCNFDVESKVMNTTPLKIFNQNHKYTSFKSKLHFKDEG